MMGHLNERELAEVIAGEGCDAARRHLAECATCRAETDRFGHQIAGLRQELRAEIDRSPDFWTRQRLGILGRMTARPVSHWMRWAYVAVTALVLVAATLSVRGPHPPAQVAPVGTPAVMSDEFDDALLRGVESDVEREIPQALEPAVLLSKERGSWPADEFSYVTSESSQ
jgi:hypothetical protein